MNRRKASTFLLAAALPGLASLTAAAQVRPFVLRLVRTNGWEQLMQREHCIPGTLYTVDPDRLLTDVPGQPLCHTMELPQRANANDISAIPRGRYTVQARVSPHNGPVLELAVVPRRAAVQMHAGNTVDHTLGCILLGDAPVSTVRQVGSDVLAAGKCWISGSRRARDKLLASYGWSDLDRPPPARTAVIMIE